jgi:DNA-directed RNA polymerase subunit K/omega
MEADKFTRYEMARILGARALQIAMNAPLLIKISEEDLQKINFDALKIAEVELNSNVLPIIVNKPMPQKKEAALRRAKERKIDDDELAEEEAKRKRN